MGLAVAAALLLTCLAAVTVGSPVLVAPRERHLLGAAAPLLLQAATAQPSDRDKALLRPPMVREASSRLRRGAALCCTRPSTRIHADSHARRAGGPGTPATRTA